MTKAEAIKLLKQRMKIIRVSIFGMGEDKYFDSPFYKAVRDRLIDEDNETLKQLAAPHKKEVKKFIAALYEIERIAKESDELWIRHGVLSAYKDTIELQDVFGLRGGGLADIKARDYVGPAKAKFDLRCLELEEKLLITYSEDPQKAEEFLSTLPDVETIMEELLA